MKYKIEHKVRKNSTTFTVVDELGNKIATRTSKDRWYVGAKVVAAYKIVTQDWETAELSYREPEENESAPFVLSWHMTMDQAHKPIPGYLQDRQALVAVATGPECGEVAK